MWAPVEPYSIEQFNDRAQHLMYILVKSFVFKVFHERKMTDEESISANNNIDFNSPQDLQDQIQARVQYA